MNLTPLSGEYFATFPHVLESSGLPPVPNPILESQLLQSSSLFPTKPILALVLDTREQTALKPSMLQLNCKEAREPMIFFHVLRPSEVGRYCPSAIREYKESATWFITRKLIFSSSWILIPRQIFVKGVSQ